MKKKEEKSIVSFEVRQNGELRELKLTRTTPIGIVCTQAAGGKTNAGVCLVESMIEQSNIQVFWFGWAPTEKSDFDHAGNRLLELVNSNPEKLNVADEFRNLEEISVPENSLVIFDEPLVHNIKDGQIKTFVETNRCAAVILTRDVEMKACMEKAKFILTSHLQNGIREGTIGYAVLVGKLNDSDVKNILDLPENFKPYELLLIDDFISFRKVRFSDPSLV